MEEKPKTIRFQGRHRQMLRSRGLDPRNFVIIKETYTSLYLRDIRYGTIKILYKRN